MDRAAAEAAIERQMANDQRRRVAVVQRRVAEKQAAVERARRLNQANRSAAAKVIAARYASTVTPVPSASRGSGGRR